MLRVERHTNGPRLYIFGLRVHHALTGIALGALGAATHHPLLALAGAVLVVDDAHDFPWRMRERAVSPSRNS